MRLFIQEETLNEIAHAIREKTETGDLIAPGDMPAMIRGIESGGGGFEPTEEDLTLTGDCQYRFAYNGWNWVIENFGDRITSHHVSNINHMFMGSGKLEVIPFDINVDYYGSTVYIASFCNNCYNLREFKGKISGVYPANGTSLFYACHNLRELPVMENWDWSYMHTMSYQSLSTIFEACYSLRSIPEDWLKEVYNAYTSYYGSQYYNFFYQCYSLNEVRGVPVARECSYTSNVFEGTFGCCRRLKEVIFDTDNGTPYTVNWSNQKINLASIGPGIQEYERTYLLNYNSGITADKEVTDAASYQALKDDPDWWTSMKEYCRYNHDSAVNTINSLPITTGSGCVLQLPSGDAGSLTDGGAINTLTEEEIAVATAKGWTVSFV